MNPGSTSGSFRSLNEKVRQQSRAESPCSIYRVHRHLRNVNPKSYEPEVVAIGPYHRDSDHLQFMEHHKLHYLGSLVRRQKEHNVDRYMTAITRVESRARKCYAEPINLDEIEFVEMLILDGCFIVELVRKFDSAHLRERNDPIFQMGWIISSLNRDFLLFENQVPLFILFELYDLIEAPNQHLRLTYLLINFFKIFCPPNLRANLATNEMKHVLSLIHHIWISRQFHQSEELVVHASKGFKFCQRVEGWLRATCGSTASQGLGSSSYRNNKFINNATGLREANVRFERNESAALLDIKFKDGVMRMAPLTVEDRTESFFRNLIAYEQYFHGDQVRFVTDYVKLLDCLIDSSNDVEVLSRNGIIENWLGDDEVVATMVNRLTDSVADPGNSFIYAKIFEKVNNHCKNRRNRWMAKLRRNYLNSPWGVISIIVALVLLLLTVTQTVFTILQVVL